MIKILGCDAMEWQREEARKILKNSDIDTVAHYMDDAIREDLHGKLSPCSDLDFLTIYIGEHGEAHGEVFTIN